MAVFMLLELSKMCFGIEYLNYILNANLQF